MIFDETAAFVYPDGKQFKKIDPELIKNILIKDFAVFADRTIFNNTKDDPMGSHLLFLLKTPDWRDMRRKITPVFTSGKMKNMYPLIAEVGENMVHYLTEYVSQNPVVEVKEVTAKYTTDDSATFLRNAFWRTMHEREEKKFIRNDLLDILIEIKNQEDIDDPYKLEGDKLVAQATQFFLAGFETSSSAITFALYELAVNQDIQRKLRKEIVNVLSRFNGIISYESLKEMEYLDMCVKDPEKFDPTRFTEENVKSRPQFTYLPFGEGPRNCIDLATLVERILAYELGGVRRNQFRLDLDAVVDLSALSIFNNEKDDPMGSHLLFLLKTPDWRDMRRKISPVFTSGKMKNMYRLIAEVGEDMMQYLTKHVSKNPVVEVKEITAKYTTDSITSAAFGINANCFKNENAEFRVVSRRVLNWSLLERAISTSCYFIAPNLVKLFKLKFVDTESATFLRNAFWRTMNEREEKKFIRNDLLDILIDIRKQEDIDDSYKLEGDKLVAQATQFFLAGFETTSSTISFALYELAINQDIQRKLRKEIRNVLSKFDEEISYESLKEMEYLDMCVKETLRKYPVLPFLDRRNNADYPIAGSDVVLEKGTPIFISIWGLHFDPTYYPDPEKFDPMRFTEENVKSRPQFTYLPFGEGPRNCIELIKSILVRDFNNFEDRNVASAAHDPLVSNMLFLNKNPEWKTVRVKMTPVFTTGKLKAMIPLMNDVGETMKKYIENQIPNFSVEAKEICAKYSTDVIAKCAFAINAHSFKSDDAEFRKIDPKASDFLRETFWHAIKLRQGRNQKANDVIDAIIGMKENQEFCTNNNFEGDKVVAQAAQFFVAGFETTSSTMAFTLYELCLHPNIQRKLKNEIETCLKQHGGFTYEAIQSMKYLHMCVCETLRKYPVLPFLDRRCKEDYQLPGSKKKKKKGTPVFIPMFGIHYDEEYFPEPNKFIPERFSDENVKNLTPFSYIPFGEGPRNCIDKKVDYLSRPAAELLNHSPIPFDRSSKSSDVNRVSVKSVNKNLEKWLNYRRPVKLPQTDPEERVINLDEVSWHDNPNDCWIIIYDRVYNITDFLDEHPGGGDILLEYAGRDASVAFRGSGHSQQALRALDRFLVGELPMHERIFRKPGGYHLSDIPE
ncbi:hypothetical protein GEV33_003067 [Tenebrio molitor]|uniref:Cytochrome b5 heme-binding domain-containing protein n=1 Tax=Tenebrio molitor TaxID=7067 RepID=A0A8J6HS63_TENMO|nr:hypothetical protein GEV33_003067 [Tenebrio molitor]